MAGTRQTLYAFFTLMMLALMFIPSEGLAALELYLADGQTKHTDPAPLPPLVGRLPVLFVHGHNTDDDQDTDFNFRKNWRNEPPGFTSFRQALEEVPQNQLLGIEPYFIRFQLQHRSIVHDAQEIAAAIDWILQRHDPSFDPNDPASRTPVQVAIIAYSKGTISSRYYLKGLRDQQVAQQLGMLAPRADYFPVSEFIAIAPPNHGLRWPLLPSQSDRVSTRQLNNGYTPYLCDCYTDATGSCDPVTVDFIERLNGHSIEHTRTAATLAAAPTSDLAKEAPGSRPNGDAPTTGTLYLSLYANQINNENRDFVGGHTPRQPADCQGRVMAKNVAPDAENIEVNEIVGTDTGEVHQNTVHTPEIICLALYTAVHHRAPMNVPSCRNLPAGAPPVVPPPPRAAAMLALDMSGSMLSEACPGCATRLQILQQAVDLFVQLWTLVGTDNDFIGVTYFRTQVDELIIGNEAMFPLLPNAVTVSGDVAGQVVSLTSLTAMGSALESGVNRLQALPPAPAEHARRIILFTDGMQNVPPLVDAIPEGCVGSACNYEIGGIALNTTLGIEIDTIGIDNGGLYTDLLNGISEKTGGHPYLTTTINDNLREFFINALINALRSFSPQLVAYRRATLANDEATETFSVNRSARKLVLKLSWHTGQPMSFRVEKDGEDLTALGRMIDGPFYRIYALDLPATLGGTSVETDGEWRMRITGHAGMKYEAAAIVDEPLLQYQTVFNTRRLKTGDPLELEVRLMHNGQPLQADAELTATILRPGQSLGTLLSQSPNLPEPADFQSESGTSVGQRKLQLLLKDKAFWARLEPVTERVTLSHQGEGRYTAVTTATTVPGTYRAVISINGEAEGVGRFVRSETLSTHVNFADAEITLSEPRIQQIAETADGRQLRLSLRPKDRLGNFLGPDYASHIQVTLGEGTVAKEIKDHADGRYDIGLSVPSTSDPMLSITVLGDSVFSGTLSELDVIADGRNATSWFYLLVILVVAVFIILWWLIKRSR